MPADPSTDLLLITCASGKQASALLPLLPHWKNMRLVVHSPTSKTRLQSQYPHAEVLNTDLYSPTATSSLIRNANVVLHIGPSYHPHETEIGYMMIDAAVTAYDSGKGHLKHFILSSVLNTQLRKMMNHDCKRYVEEYVIESGLPYTILQPTTFMDNLPIPVFMKEERPVFRCGWDTDIQFSWIALKDLAEGMNKVLEEREKHFSAQYPLVSTHDTVSFAQAISIIGDKLGKKIEVETALFKEAVDNLCLRVYGTTEGVDQRSRDAAQRMILFYDNRGLVGNPNVLEWLLGREATQFGEWVEGNMGEVK
ncbi:NAD(P)-binding protein [Lindgomyces ingoldianus]|uniref:NAD(P)-binding protein n=1 Tax=Lindgomyces ingoldianus TaxID=673940 RepID=A0ACB6R110_9PLEO|nr:NAD(P)-binding protein [Lindgomyces ingoldianus]KAF2472974.1 NAD(P)-binding protein [Lindgomyces ingoldianus]